LQNSGRERAILVGLELKRRAAASFDSEESLQELAELASSAGAALVERVMQTRDRVEAATLI